MTWENILKLKGTLSSGDEVDWSPKKITDYLTYRSWAWQNEKARVEEGLGSGDGWDDKEHLEQILNTKRKADKYRIYKPSPEQTKIWIQTWNREFGERLDAVYPTGDE